MKKFLAPICMLFIINTYAHIEHDGNRGEPSAEDLSKSRACFEELSQNGCGDPGDDHKQFRACLHNVFPTLNKDCQKMMTNLYSRK